MTGGAQFKVAQYLQQIGLRDGDKVAVVANGNQIRCTWAYVSGVHVVTGMGNDAYDPKDQVQDLHLFFDHADTRQQVLNVFRQQGAIAVVAPNMPFDINSFGWQRVPETHTWVFRF